ncbi:MAG: hypothetical protein ACTSYA_10440 [Candidatus Kariarchaeaceae archaeon]
MDLSYDDDDIFEPYSLEKEAKSLKELLTTYNFKGGEELGKRIPAYNNAIRTDVIREHRACIIRDPVKLKEVFDFFNKQGEIFYGLKVQLGSNTVYIHALLKTKGKVKGIWFFDYNKPLSTNKVIQICQTLEDVGINEGIIVTNLFSGHAKDFLVREEKENGIAIKLLYSSETTLPDY